MKKLTADKAGDVAANLGRLLASMPHLETCELTNRGVQEWLGEATAAVESVGDLMDSVSFKSSVDFLQMIRETNAHKIRAILNRSLARAQALLPKTPAAAFIKSGDKFSAFTTIADIVRTAAKDVLIVDPYMEDRALRDYGPAVPEGVTFRLLANKKRQNDVLVPAAGAWSATHASRRPLSVRRANASALHDRFIAIDGAQVWLMSQSLNGFAEHGPATVVRFDDALAIDKLAAYQVIWDAAEVVV